MIAALYDRERGTLRVSGHAGGRKGSDIVCAGVSALVCTLAAYLAERGESSLAQGRAEITLRDAQDASTCTAMDFAAAGIELIARKNPERVSMERK